MNTKFKSRLFCFLVIIFNLVLSGCGEDGAGELFVPDASGDGSPSAREAAVEIYTQQCATCHGSSGSGMGSNGPALNIGYLEPVMVEHVRRMPPGVGVSCDGLDNCELELARYIIEEFARPNNAPVAVIETDDADMRVEIPAMINFSAGNSIDDHGVNHFAWTLPGGEVREGVDTSFVFRESGTHRFELEVSDEEGLTNRTFVSVTAVRAAEDQPPVASISITPQSALVGRAVSFDASGSADDSSISAYFWEIQGTGVTSTQMQFQYAFQQAGTFTVRLTVTDDAGQSNTASRDIVVDTPPESEVVQQIYVSQCASCHGTSGEGGNGYPALDIGYSLDVMVGHVRRMPPNSSVDCGSLSNCEVGLAQYIIDNFARVNMPPVAVMTTDDMDLRGEVPYQVRFSGMGSTDDHRVASYAWVFPSGPVQTGEQVSYTFTQPGTYSVELVVTDEEGLSSRDTVTLTVVAASVDQPPVAAITASSTTVIVNNALSFDASGSRDDSAISAYRWEILGIGLVSNQVQFQHVFDQVGTFTVRLTVTDDAGQTGVATIDVVVQQEPNVDVSQQLYMNQCAACHGDNGQGIGVNPALNIGYPLDVMIGHVLRMPPGVGITCGSVPNCEVGVAHYILDNFARPNLAPTAVIAADDPDLTGEVPYQVSFSASNSMDDHRIAGYTWVLPDNSTQTGEQVTYIFTQPGTYSVALTVADEEGLSARDTLTLTAVAASVDQPPVASIQASSQSVIVNDAIDFDASGSVDDSAINVYQWEILGTGLVSTQVQFRHVFDQAGSYTVRLTVTDDAGQNGMASISIDVRNDPNSDYANYFQCPSPTLAAEASAGPLNRLSRQQYINTLSDVLRWRMGESVAVNLLGQLAASLDAIPLDTHDSGFTKFDQRVSTFHLEAYIDIADQLAGALAGDDNWRNQFVGGVCAADFADTACKTAFINEVGERIYRRRIEQEDRNHLLRAGDYREMISAMLMSPSFLTHSEFRGAPVTNRNDLVDLTDYEIANRLSYLFWNTLPDDALFDDARNGRVRANLDAIVTRVFQDAKTSNAVRQFYREWLKLDRIPAINPNDGADFGPFLQVDYNAQPSDTSLPSNADLDAYRRGAIDEVVELGHYYTVVNPGPYSELFTSRLAFTSEPLLARAYGVDRWTGDYSNIPTFPMAERAGVLTRAALSIFGSAKSRPILKGVEVRKDILCDTLEPPADNSVPAGAVIEPYYSEREHTEAITEVPGSSCESCHRPQINPLGFATERYDALGRFRDFSLVLDPATGNEISRRSIDEQNLVPRIELDDGMTIINGPVELSQLISQNGKTKACFVRKYFRYTHARRESTANTDDCVMSRMFNTIDSTTLDVFFQSIARQSEFLQRKLP